MNGELIKMGVAGAVAIYAARQIPSIRNTMDKGAANNGKAIPLIPVDFMSRNSISAAFFILPALGAWYLTK